jgi:two-component system, OmpR family, response regulator
MELCSKLLCDMAPDGIVSPDVCQLRILLIDDDQEMVNCVISSLGQDGHTFDVADNAGDALRLASAKTHDLLIVDRCLPDGDGAVIVRSFRSAGGTAPVIFLTTMSGIEDCAEALESDADDYLVKPVSLSELRVRVQALCGLPALSQAETVLRAGDLEQDLIGRKVTRGSHEIELQPLEFRILEYFMRHQGRVITREMLLNRVWNFHFAPNTAVVEANIARLRSKINAPYKQPLLHVLRGSVYVLAAPGADFQLHPIERGATVATKVWSVPMEAEP